MSDWKNVEKNGAKGVYSRGFNWPDMVYGDFDTIKLFRVEPNGVFPNHVDNYHHLIEVESGECIFSLGGEEYKMKSGHIIAVEAGKMHGYRNDGEKDLLLIVCNTKPI